MGIILSIIVVAILLYWIFPFESLFFYLLHLYCKFKIENTFEDEVCIAERNKRIYDCMEYLPSAQKEALYLVYIEGMSYKEAAAVLRKSAKQIDKLLQLGKKKLRPLLETEGIKSAFND